MLPTYSLSTSRAQLGFILPTEQATDRRYKLRIRHSDYIDTYDITPGISYTFPLKYGSGSYTVMLYEQVGRIRYATVWMEFLDVVLDDPDACYLYPNVYVDYDAEVEELSRHLCEGKTERESYDTVLRYVKTHFRYDFIKAIQRTGFMLPDIRGTMKTGLGICQDLAAVTVGLLRSAGIVSKLVIGHADGNYHAWVESRVDGRWRRFDPTAVLRGMKPKRYITERYY